MLQWGLIRTMANEVVFVEQVLTIISSDVDAQKWSTYKILVDELYKICDLNANSDLTDDLHIDKEKSINHIEDKKKR